MRVSCNINISIWPTECQIVGEIAIKEMETENKNKNNRKPRFNGEYKNCGKIGHRADDCWAKKGKDKDDDIGNLFVVATFCGEVSEEDKEEDIK